MARGVDHQDALKTARELDAQSVSSTRLTKDMSPRAAISMIVGPRISGGVESMTEVTLMSAIAWTGTA